MSYKINVSVQAQICFTGLSALSCFHFKLAFTLLCLSYCGVSALMAEPPRYANITQSPKQGFSFNHGRDSSDQPPLFHQQLFIPFIMFSLFTPYHFQTTYSGIEIFREFKIRCFPECVSANYRLNNTPPSANTLSHNLSPLLPDL